MRQALGRRNEHCNETAEPDTELGKSRSTHTECQVQGQERDGTRQQSASVRTNGIRDNSQKAAQVSSEIDSVLLCWIRMTACIRRVPHAQSADWEDF